VTTRLCVQRRVSAVPNTMSKNSRYRDEARWVHVRVSATRPASKTNSQTGGARLAAHSVPANAARRKANRGSQPSAVRYS